MEKSLAELYAIDLLGVLIMERVDGDFRGELIEQYSTKRVPFYGVLDLIKKMEMQGPCVGLSADLFTGQKLPEETEVCLSRQKREERLCG